ncbi:hypothetical protein G3N57_00640 [Paraburkholderia sp. Se-20369]|nr:hypothetical protein [Paraburkholderia sp. Se-20369]
MKTKLTYAVAMIALGAATTAQATFVVNDDAPSITAANPHGPKRETTSTLSFYGTRLSRASNSTLNDAAYDLVAADAISLNAYARNKALMVNAKRRVATVKDWLIAHGVQAAKIDIYTEISPNYDANDTDVQMTLRTIANRSAPDAVRTPPVAVAPYDIAATPAPAPRAQSSMSEHDRLDFARRVMALAQAKVISGDDAIRLVNEFLNGGQGGTIQTAAAPAQQATPQPVVTAALNASPNVGGPIAIAQPEQIIPASELSRTWTLAANKSLRENLEDWAAQAGYSKPTWSSSTPYQITYTSNYTGTFLQVLGQISQKVPLLDFQVSKSRHTLSVVDARN